MNELQVRQFNKMLQTLKTIVYEFQDSETIRETAESKYGLDPEEAIEMAYDNIKAYAAEAIEGIEKLPNPPLPIME